MRLSKTSACLGIAIGFLLQFYALGQSASPSQTAIDAWRSSVERIKTFQIEYEYADNGGKGLMRMSGNGELLKSERRNLPGSKDKDDSAAIRNEYGFLLDKRNSKWQLSRVFERDEFFPNVDHVRNTAAVGFSAMGVCTLDKVSDHSDLEVAVWLDDVNANNKSYAYCKLECTASKPEFFQVLELWLEPDKHFRIARCKPQRPRGTEVLYGDFVYEYADRAGLWDIIPEKRTETWSIDSTNKLVSTVKTISVDSRAVPEAEFELSYYGLPNYEPGRKGYFTYYVAIGLLVVAGVLLRMVVRR